MPAREDSDREAWTRRRLDRVSAIDDVQRQANLKVTVRAGNVVQQEASLHPPTRLAFFHRTNRQQEELHRRARLQSQIQDHCENLRPICTAERGRQGEVRLGGHLGIDVHILLQEQRNSDASRTGRVQ